MEHEVLLLQFPGGVIVTLEEALGYIAQGVGGGVEMAHDRKVLLFIVYRAQMVYKMVSEPSLGLTDVEEPHWEQQIQETMLTGVQVNLCLMWKVCFVPSMELVGEVSGQ
eukprot:g47038.t1